MIKHITLATFIFYIFTSIASKGSEGKGSEPDEVTPRRHVSIKTPLATTKDVEDTKGFVKEACNNHKFLKNFSKNPHIDYEMMEIMLRGIKQDKDETYFYNMPCGDNIYIYESKKLSKIGQLNRFDKWCFWKDKTLEVRHLHFNAWPFVVFSDHLSYIFIHLFWIFHHPLHLEENEIEELKQHKQHFVVNIHRDPEKLPSDQKELHPLTSRTMPKTSPRLTPPKDFTLSGDSPRGNSRKLEQKIQKMQVARTKHNHPQSSDNVSPTSSSRSPSLSPKSSPLSAPSSADREVTPTGQIGISGGSQRSVIATAPDRDQGDIFKIPQAYNQSHVFHVVECLPNEDKPGMKEDKAPLKIVVNLSDSQMGLHLRKAVSDCVLGAIDAATQRFIDPQCHFVFNFPDMSSVSSNEYDSNEYLHQPLYELHRSEPYSGSERTCSSPAHTSHGISSWGKERKSNAAAELEDTYGF